MSVQADFDRLALVSDDGATHNDFYHNFLLRHLPSCRESALEIGCGAGTFSRRLAAHFDQVLALDISPEMIRLARERSAEFPNIEYKLADVLDYDLPAESFDCIATSATLHHLPYREMLVKMKAALKPDGVLLILDLFEPAGLFESGGLTDTVLNFIAFPVSVALRVKHYGRLRRSKEARAAWATHEAHDLYPTMTEVRALCAELLPGAKIRKHLLWRYSIVWQKD
ncbi:MAG TPA: class I SAM-dependent methyltransferase [Pyrinomonadaceae bacterium]|nr:class I SAM-dependent methyltransferase [Pyrinomonadaceae bacterium]